MKLSRKDIKEALQQTPIEDILLGHQTGGVNLTAKQKAFAEEVAKGTPKAKAYRQTYNTQADKQTQANSAHKLAQIPKIQAMIDSFKVANEAMKYQTPLQLRALAVQRLVELSIDEDVKPAQQLKALELIGKITEVALFTERREIIKTTNPQEAREKLIESIKLALRNENVQDAETVDETDTEADDLLNTIKRGKAEVMNGKRAQTEAEAIEAEPAEEDTEEEGDGIDKSQELDPTTPQPPKID
jgi:hypothetical protein